MDLYTTHLYSGPSLKGHSVERTPLYKGHTFRQQVILLMDVMLLLTKGNLSNKDQTFWQIMRGVLIRGGLL